VWFPKLYSSFWLIVSTICIKLPASSSLFVPGRTIHYKLAGLLVGDN